MRRNSRLDEVIPTFESKGFISLLCEGNAMFDGNAFQLSSNKIKPYYDWVVKSVKKNMFPTNCVYYVNLKRKD